MDGYAKLAWRMSAYPEFAIVRRFRALHLQNILYLQAELVELESQLRAREQENVRSEDRTKYFSARDWFTLSTDRPEEDGTVTQWDLFLQLRAKLREYS